MDTFVLIYWLLHKNWWDDLKINIITGSISPLLSCLDLPCLALPLYCHCIAIVLLLICHCLAIVLLWFALVLFLPLPCFLPCLIKTDTVYYKDCQDKCLENRMRIIRFAIFGLLTVRGFNLKTDKGRSSMTLSRKWDIYIRNYRAMLQAMLW